MEDEVLEINTSNDTVEEVANISEDYISEDAINAQTTASASENRREDIDKAIDIAKEKAKWYVLHTFSGYENVAKENLEIVKDKYNLQERVFDIVIPMEDVVEEKDGKQKIVSRKIMPGYIMVSMIYGDDIWHAITRTRGITGFVGPKGRPLPLTEEEVRKMSLEKPKNLDINLVEGDKVEVLDGALNGFIGSIISVDLENAKVKVMVEMFGRDMPVDLALDQIRRI